MPSTSFYNNYGKTFKKPRRPFEKERLDAEMKLLGEFGLRAKREIWRVQMALSKIRTAARTLLTMDEKDPKRIFEGEALLRRMYRYGLLVRRCSRAQGHLRLRWRGGPKPCSLGFQPAAPAGGDGLSAARLWQRGALGCCAAAEPLRDEAPAGKGGLPGPPPLVAVRPV
jgi:hypothetical protein